MRNRLLVLRERRPRECRLAPEEVALLLDRHRAHVRLEPTVQHHVWKLTAQSVAGFIQTPLRTIHLVPRLAPDHMLAYLDPAFAAAEVHEYGKQPAIPWFASQIAQRMREVARDGLHRDYREQHSQGAYLVGRLDVARQVRQQASLRDQICSRHDEFTQDLPWNLVPRSLAEDLASSPLLSEVSRASLREALADFGAVPLQPVTPALLAGLRLPAAPERYQSLIQLCLLLLETLFVAPGVGPHGSPALVLRLDRLLECYLVRVVEESLVGVFSIRMVAQESLMVDERGEVLIRPDVRIDLADRPHIVLDAKWKTLVAMPEPDDLYQAISYASLLGLDQVILVYPGRGQRTLTFPRSSVRVILLGLEVGSTASRAAWARCRLARLLRRWIGVKR